VARGCAKCVAAWPAWRRAWARCCRGQGRRAVGRSAQAAALIAGAGWQGWGDRPSTSCTLGRARNTECLWACCWPCCWLWRLKYAERIRPFIGVGYYLAQGLNNIIYIDLL